MNQTTERASTIVMVAGLVGLAVTLAACSVADGDTAEGGQGIR